MKTFVFLLCVLLCSIIVQSARAEWTGTQVLLIGAADNVTFDEQDPTLAMRASVHYFLQPSTNTDLLFAYAGPRFNISEQLWISPQIGSAVAWAPDGGDALLTSVWIGATPYPRWFGFHESDVYFYDDTWSVYNYTFIDYMLSNMLALGPTLEMVDELIAAGPHLTLYTKAGPWFSIQHYLDMRELGDQTVRFVTGCFFL